ncbi:MAG: MFS transporter [Ahrensia sp.]|nr:MFS transporter [Ahrensia sp.]
MNPTLPLAPMLALAVGQTLIWAATFYLFPALLLQFEAGTGWSKTSLTAAYTGALLVAAAASSSVGRLVDAGRGRNTIIGGMVAAIILLTALSQVKAYWQFMTLWLLLGVVMATSLYEPCFAMLVRHLGVRARAAITRITLVAGFAGTISFPVANWIAAQADWRAAVLTFAALVLLIALPCTIWGLSRLVLLSVAGEELETHASKRKRSPRMSFWLLAIAFALTTVNHSMLINHLLPMLAERGVAAVFAVTAASMIGPMQVAGRVVMIATERHVSNRATTVFCFVSMTLAVLCLWTAGASETLIFTFVVLQGAPWGVMSIARPAVTRDVLGAAGFGVNSGRISGLSLAGAAIAPFGGALIWSAAGYNALLLFAFAMMAVATIIIAVGTARG